MIYKNSSNNTIVEFGYGTLNMNAGFMVAKDNMELTRSGFVAFKEIPKQEKGSEIPEEYRAKNIGKDCDVILALPDVRSIETLIKTLNSMKEKMIEKNMPYDIENKEMKLGCKILNINEKRGGK